MVFLVSGPRRTPLPETPAPPAAAEEVDAAGAEERRRDVRVEGREAVTVGYKLATCTRVRRRFSESVAAPEGGLGGEDDADIPDR